MPTSLAQKLQIKSGKLIVLNAPKGYAEQLATGVEGPHSIHTCCRPG